MRIIKENAAQWNINPDSIGIMGFSAVGQLASTYAPKAPASLRTSLQISFYPFISHAIADPHLASQASVVWYDHAQALTRL